MAVPISQEAEQENDDIQKLALAQSYFIMAESAAWKDLMERFDGLILAARNDMFKSRATDANTMIEEKVRWQQRELAKAAIDEIVSAQWKVRQDILEEMNKEQNSEYTSADPE